jgi:hypothetical protein
MQAYIEHCKDYNVGKRKTNEMHGINHEFEILLHHLDDTNFLAPNAPYYNRDEYFEEDPNKIMNLTLTTTWKTLTFHNLYMMISTNESMVKYTNW